MALAPGSRLGPFEISVLLGAGGMGEVYRARDTRLNRDVAIKVLLPSVVADPSRIARFAREAQLLAALNHPNVAHLHGLEEDEGVRGLVMELVEGPTLADRLRRGAMAVDEALPVAKQLAEALEAAHRQGIVHRDLKPGNIKIRPDGIVKVLDFGLAKALAPEMAYADTPQSSTLTMHETASGMILGTAAYMSPEQARGLPVDERADIWGFGAVLYEMLTGRRAFEASDLSTTLALVLTGQPDWSAVPAATPPLVVRLLRRCLEKDLRLRLPDIAVARLDIDEALSTPANAIASSAQGMATRPQRHAPSILVAVVASAAAALATWLLVRPAASPSPMVTRFAIALPASQALSLGFTASDVALSGDGTQLVHVGGPEAQLILRPLGSLDAAPIAGVANARAPFFSPDGRWIGFFDMGGTLRKVSVTGGTAITVCRVTGQLRGASWAPDDTIVFATSDLSTGLLRVAAGGGEPAVLTRPVPIKGEKGEEARDHYYPSMLPRGRGVLFTIDVPGATAAFNATPDVAVLDLKSGEQKTLVRGASQATYLESGHLVYGIGGTLWAAPFDVNSLSITGDQVPVLQRLDSHPLQYSLSARGTLVYVPDPAGAARTLVWIDRHGQETPIELPAGSFNYPRLSPDGSQAAFTATDQGNTDIWSWDFRRQAATRLTFEASAETYPVWLPDGRRIAYRSIRSNDYALLVHAADGTGTPEVIAVSPYELRPTTVSADGKRLVAEQLLPDNNAWDIVEIPVAARSTTGLLDAKALVRTPFDERNATTSPDGRWLAYESNESAQTEVYLRALSSGTKYQLSTGGGRTPSWSADGRELFFVNGTRLLVSHVQLSPTFSHDTPSTLLDLPTILFDARTAGGGSGRMYDVARDGQRFLMVKRSPANGETAAANMVIVENWQEELKQRVPVR